MEERIVEKEGGIDSDLSDKLVKLGIMTRGLKDSGLAEGASTRLLIQTAQLYKSGVAIPDACRAGIIQSLTDDPHLIAAIEDMAEALF